ncbi:hypothetical protein B4U80_11927 [Leptotrombidium deliense]|uniref:Caspase family p20 domain-containing protein n=1 Tax=Leptotrombidium deliense TaxID=299467 RepID=A0A443S0R4_9ACAR|nr:hypothetical protein B4U80_11927 [Leptotrombidium deliense]
MVTRKIDMKMNTNPESNNVTEFQTHNFCKRFFFFPELLLHYKPDFKFVIFTQLGNADASEKGICIFIINNDYKNRNITRFEEYDYKKEQQIFQRLGFKVIEIKDKPKKVSEGKKGLEEEYAEAIEQVNKNHLAVFIFISTHTTEDFMLTVDSEYIPYSDLSDALSDEQRPDLQHLPKFMFVQGCESIIFFIYFY